MQKLSPSDRFADRIAANRVDTGSEAEVADGLKDAVSKFGSLEILINAVGCVREKAPLVETDMDIIRRGETFYEHRCQCPIFIQSLDN